MSAPRCEITPSEIRTLRAQFTKLHEGRPPDQILCDRVHGIVKPVRTLGQMTEIQYKKAVSDGRYSYHHPFAPHARPKVGIDARGNLVIYAGKYYVSIRDSAIGIVDRSAGSVRPETLPTPPASLMQLGTLEWIRYQFLDSGVTRARTLRFYGLNTSIERDEKGNLHVVPSKVSNHEENMRRKRRHNPVKIEGKGGAPAGLNTVAMAAVGVGLVGAVLAESADRFLGSKLFGYKKALAEGLGGIGLAYAASRLKAPGEVVLGIGGTGVLMAARDGLHTWQASRAAVQLPAPQVPVTQTPAATAPKAAAYALNPGGLPYGYAYTGRAACGVRR